jgi:DNA-binding MarR family transcriptional regulator
MTIDDAGGSETPVPSTDLVDALVQCSFVTVAALTRIGTEYDLSLTQLRVLGILRDRRLRMSQLAEYLGLDRSTLSGLVDRAEKRDLIRRTPSADDRRAIDVALTATGVRLAERVQAQVAQALAPVTGMLTDSERTRVTGLLRRMLDHSRPEGPAGSSRRQ